MKPNLKRNFLSLLALAAFIALALGSSDPNDRHSSSYNSGSSTSQDSSPSSQESPKELALRSVKLDFKWSTGGFGTVMEADFTIQNPTEYTIKDMEITCTHFAKSGTKIDSNTRTIYDTVPAKGKKVIRNFNMGFIHSQANSSSCEIVDLEIVR